MSRYLFRFLSLFTIISLFVFVCFDPYRTYYYVLMLGLYSLTGLLNYLNANKFTKLLILNVSFTFLSELSVRFLILYHLESYLVYHLFIPVQIAFYAFLYPKLLIKSHKKLLILLALLFISTCLINSIFIQKIHSLPSIGFVLLACFAIPLSLIKFKEMLNSPISQRLRFQSDFWFNLGTFFFYSTSFFIFSFFPLIQNGPGWMYDLPWFANIYFYAFYFISIMLSIEQKKFI
jgi:hypothetical protein